MQFQDELAAGVVLVRPALQSPDYTPGVSGWAIKIDGSAEFNNVVIRGGTVVSGLALYYDGTPAAGNLIMSIAAEAGTDEFGNDYVSGMTVYDSSGSSIQVDAGSGTSAIYFTPPDVPGVTWHTGSMGSSLGSRLGTNTPQVFLTAPYDTDFASNAMISLFGNPETSNGDVTNEIFMSTFRVHVTGDHEVVGSSTAGNRDHGTGSAVLSAVPSVDVTVTFNKTFPAIPRVVASLRGNPTLPAGSSNMNIRPFNITTTGCTMRVADQGGTARTLTHAFDWHAESD
jgi:hypothetical protein